MWYGNTLTDKKNHFLFRHLHDMKNILLLTVAAVLLCGCGDRKNDTPGKLDSMMSETRKKAEADKGTPSDIVDVRIYYLQDEEVVSGTCSGFIMDTHSPLINNVGIILGTTDTMLLAKPFIASFPTAADKKPFTCVLFPKHLRIFDRATTNGTDCYVLNTATTTESRPTVKSGGRYESNIQPYLFALSTVLPDEPILLEE